MYAYINIDGQASDFHRREVRSEHMAAASINPYYRPHLVSNASTLGGLVGGAVCLNCDQW